MKRPRKFGNRIVVIDGEEFHSAGEARWFQNLKLIQRARAISDLKRQVPYDLHGLDGSVVASIVADAEWIDADGETVTGEFKGHETPISRLKRKLFAAEYGREIKVYTAKGELEYDRAGRRKSQRAKSAKLANRGRAPKPLRRGDVRGNGEDGGGVRQVEPLRG